MYIFKKAISSVELHVRTDLLLYRMNEKNEKASIYVYIYHQYSEILITSDFNLLQVFMLNEEQCSSFNIYLFRNMIPRLINEELCDLKVVYPLVFSQ